MLACVKFQIMTYPNLVPREIIFCLNEALRKLEIQKMAEKHWVSELFPVEFSVDDVLKISSEEKESLLKEERNKQDNYKEIYERVIAKEIASKEAWTKTEQGLPNSVPDQEEALLLQLEKEDTSNGPETVKARKESVGLWTKEELEVFRSGYFNLKKKAMRLLVLLSMAKSEVKDLKTKCKAKDKTIKDKDTIISGVSRQNKQLNASVVELKKDADFYNKQLDSCSRIETELKNQVLLLKRELVKEKSELEKIREVCKKQKSSLKLEQELGEEKLTQLKTALELNYLHEIRQLEIENAKLKEKLEKEIDGHRISRNALEKLRTHFANMHSEKSTSNLLDVVNIQSNPDL